MSLKAFHIVFMTFAILSCVGFGFWGMKHITGRDGYIVLGGSLFVGIVFVRYFVWFLQKFKKESLW